MMSQTTSGLPHIAEHTAVVALEDLGLSNEEARRVVNARISRKVKIVPAPDSPLLTTDSSC